MKVAAQKYLELLENSNELCFWDIEATGLKGDYDSILCISILPYYGNPISFSVSEVGNDKEVVEQAKNVLEQFSMWCGYYSRGYDIRMLNTRLFKWGIDFVKPSHHLDLYYQLKSKLSTNRRSQAHYMNWFQDLGIEEDAEMFKKPMGANRWSEMAFRIKDHMPEMVDRCEQDVKGLRSLYKHCKHVIGDVTK